MVQNEAALENEFLHQLNGLGYATVDVKDEASLLANLREQLGKYNDKKFSENEFKQIINI